MRESKGHLRTKSHDRVIASGEDRLDEAELPKAPRKGLELGLAYPPRVRRVGAKDVDGDVGNSHR